MADAECLARPGFWRPAAAPPGCRGGAPRNSRGSSWWAGSSGAPYS